MALSTSIRRHFFRALDKLPLSLGFFIYHTVQKFTGNYSVEREINAAESSFNTLVRLTEKAGVSIEGKKVIEIGSGWIPLMPYLIIYQGKAKMVYTYDLNEHYSKAAIKELKRLLAEKKNIYTEKCGGKYNLPDSIKYFSRTNLANQKMVAAEIVFSRYVLEHVTPEDIRAMHIKFKKELKPGAVIVHIISPSDHRAYYDKSLSLQDFLRFSKEEWKKEHTKFDYHNRLRLPEYVDLFKSLGYEIIHLQFSTAKKDSPAYKKFKGVSLHEDYEKFSEEELTAGNIKIAIQV